MEVPAALGASGLASNVLGGDERHLMGDSYRLGVVAHRRGASLQLASDPRRGAAAPPCVVVPQSDGHLGTDDKDRAVEWMAVGGANHPNALGSRRWLAF